MLLGAFPEIRNGLFRLIRLFFVTALYCDNSALETAINKDFYL